MEAYKGLGPSLILAGLLFAGTGASAAPPPGTTLSSCAGGIVEGSVSCGSHRPPLNTAVYADLGSLTAGASIYQDLAYSTLAYANAFYYVELFSSSGSFATATVPIMVSAAGAAAVGDSGVSATGTAFNHNSALATVSAFNNTFSACAGYACSGNSSFAGAVLQDVRPGTSGSGVGYNIWRIEVSARAETNSNYSSSFASAWADPVISIEPGYAAAHPEISLIFSANIGSPVPEPSELALLLAGLATLGFVIRRSSPIRALC